MVRSRAMHISSHISSHMAAALLAVALSACAGNAPPPAQPVPGPGPFPGPGTFYNAYYSAWYDWYPSNAARHCVDNPCHPPYADGFYSPAYGGDSDPYAEPLASLYYGLPRNMTPADARILADIYRDPYFAAQGGGMYAGRANPAPYYGGYDGMYAGPYVGPYFGLYPGFYGGMALYGSGYYGGYYGGGYYGGRHYGGGRHDAPFLPGARLVRPFHGAPPLPVPRMPRVFRPRF